MATIATIRDGLQTRLATLDSPEVAAYDVATGRERLNNGLAVAIVFPRPGGQRITSGPAGGGEYTYQFVIEIHVGLARGLGPAQDKLDALIDPAATTGVEYAIESAKTLGGIVDYTVVGTFERYGFSKLNDLDTLSALIPVECGGIL